MKLGILIAAATLQVSNFANAGSPRDEFHVITTCHSNDAGPDRGLLVRLAINANDGQQVQVAEQTSTGLINQIAYLVQQVPRDPHRMGAPLVFQNGTEGLIFWVNLSTWPSPVTGHPGGLTLNGSSTPLQCKWIAGSGAGNF